MAGVKKWRAKVRPQKGAPQVEVYVDAKTHYDARRALEAQYGKGSVEIGPTEVR